MKAWYIAKSGNVRIPVYACAQTKGESTYTYYSFADRTGGQRKQKTYADPAQAKQAADTLAESQAAGEDEEVVLQGRELRNALEALTPHGLRLDRACQLLADAIVHCPPNELVEAARYWKSSRPSGPFTPKRAKDAVNAFLGARQGKVSERRHRAETDLLGQFASQFGGRNLHEISTLEIEDWAGGRDWGKRRRNDAFKLVAQLYGEGVKRSWCSVNAADSKALKRERIGKAGSVSIFTPEQGRKLLNGVEDALKPFAALLCLSGLRKEEAARLDWAQLDAGLASGSIYLRADQAKTGTDRSIEICPALREWLMAYRRPSGPVLPAEFSDSTEGIDYVSTVMARQAGVKWAQNACRHSYASYALAAGKDAAWVVSQMGNSLVLLEKHYWARRASISRAQAAGWFEMKPAEQAQVIPLAQAVTG